jgi:hypothetical protein
VLPLLMLLPLVRLALAIASSVSAAWFTAACGVGAGRIEAAPYHLATPAPCQLSQPLTPARLPPRPSRPPAPPSPLPGHLAEPLPPSPTYALAAEQFSRPLLEPQASPAAAGARCRNVPDRAGPAPASCCLQVALATRRSVALALALTATSSPARTRTHPPAGVSLA